MPVLWPGVFTTRCTCPGKRPAYVLPQQPCAGESPWSVSLPSSTFSYITAAARSQPRWEDLHRGNRQTRVRAFFWRAVVQHLPVYQWSKVMDWILTAVLFITAPRWKYPGCSSTVKGKLIMAFFSLHRNFAARKVNATTYSDMAESRRHKIIYSLGFPLCKIENQA